MTSILLTGPAVEPTRGGQGSADHRRAYVRRNTGTISADQAELAPGVPFLAVA